MHTKDKVDETSLEQKIISDSVIFGIYICKIICINTYSTFKKDFVLFYLKNIFNVCFIIE